MAKSILEDINEKLAAVEAAIHKSFPSIVVEENFRLSDNASDESVERMRMQLAAFRHIAQKAQQTKQTRACQDALHDALVALAEAKPLNRPTEFGELMCGLTGKVIKPGKGVYLSNGYVYRASVFDKFKAGEEFFPRKLGNAQIEIDQQDVQAAQAYKKGRSINSGLNVGLMLSTFYMLVVVMTKLIGGVSLFSMLQAGLVTLGVGTGVAVGVSIGAFIAPIIALLAIGAGVGYWYFNSKHPTKLAPGVEPDVAPVVSSMAQTFTGMDIELDEINKQNNAASLRGSSEDVQNLDAPLTPIVLPRVPQGAGAVANDESVSTSTEPTAANEDAALPKPTY